MRPSKYEKKGPSAMEKFMAEIKDMDIPRLEKIRLAYEDARALTVGRGDITGTIKAQRMIDVINNETESRK
jgi:hypothetical protein